MENEQSYTQDELLDAYLNSFDLNKIHFVPFYFPSVDRNFLSMIAENIAKGCTVCDQVHNKEFEDTLYNTYKKNSK